MINKQEIERIAQSSDMIVCGYAFIRKDDGNISIINLHSPYHAAVITQGGEMIESDMDDIEFPIVKDYWMRNQKYMESMSYA